jgi:hypothetical protein
LQVIEIAASEINIMNKTIVTKAVEAQQRLTMIFETWQCFYYVQNLFLAQVNKIF